MLVIYIFILMFINSINKLIIKNIHSTFLNRITILTLLLSILYSYNSLYFQSIGKGISIYSGLFQITVQSQIVEIVLITVGISILFAWPFLSVYNSFAEINKDGLRQLGPVVPLHNTGSTTVKEIKGLTPHSDQYSLIALFSILGGSLLMSSLDLLSMYLSIELQSFALYILATLNKERLSATSAGLKYFLLGSLSSCLILLGSAIIYSYTGLTQFEALNTLMSILVQAIEPVSNSLTTFSTTGEDKLNLDLSIPLPLLHAGSELSEAVNTSIASVTSANTGLDLELNNLSILNQQVVGGYIYYGNEIKKAFTIGLIILIIGFLFKISAAPFYQWAPDVYDGTPTIVTVWLTIVVKLTILIFLLGFIEFTVPVYALSSPSYPFGLGWVTMAQGDFAFLFNTINDKLHIPSYLNTIALASQGLPAPSQLWNTGLSSHQVKNLLLISSLLSLLIGTIAGLSQNKFKRLLAFSSISHVGFLLLALGIYTQKSVDSFLFYLIQYSVTSLNIFLILLAFSDFMRLPFYINIANYLTGIQEKEVNTSLNLIKQEIPPLLTRASFPSTGEGAQASSPSVPLRGIEEVGSPVDINYIVELKGQLYKNPILSLSMAICLFSMAGVPPLIGFFSKQFVLFSSIENGNNFLSIVAILVSVISASYYLKIIKFTFFESHRDMLSSSNLGVDLGRGDIFLSTSVPQSSICKASEIHSYIIAVLTFLILFFFLDPSILLNGTQLISLTIFHI